MLFRKRITPSCSYCLHGTKLEGTEILCVKKGLRDASEKCRKFRYDPCKRVPVKAKSLDFSEYANRDFSL